MLSLSSYSPRAGPTNLNSTQPPMMMKIEEKAALFSQNRIPLCPAQSSATFLAGSILSQPSGKSCLSLHRALPTSGRSGRARDCWAWSGRLCLRGPAFPRALLSVGEASSEVVGGPLFRASARTVGVCRSGRRWSAAQLQWRASADVDMMRMASDLCKPFRATSYAPNIKTKSS